MRVNVIGAGYIGLPTAVVLASNGFDVWAVDNNVTVVEKLKSKIFSYTEPGLNALLIDVLDSGHLGIGLKPKVAEVYIVTVPTPFNENREANLVFVEDAVNSILPLLKSGDLILVESTVPLGTTDLLASYIFKQRPELSTDTLFIAHCPERVLPGQILKELVENSRIIGGLNEESTNQATKFYSKFVNGKLLTTDCNTAELTKLAENAFRDVNIALANEFASICEEKSIDVWEMIRLANHHPRVNILNPGAGVGGHCIAVDPWFIISSSPKNSKLIRLAREINESIPSRVISTVVELAKTFDRPVIACLGLTYKPNVSDYRESPALEITRTLSTYSNFEILLVEPNISDILSLFEGFNNVRVCNVDEAISSANIVLTLVKHEEFLKVEPTNLLGKLVVDRAGLWK